MSRVYILADFQQLKTTVYPIGRRETNPDV